MIEQFPGRIDQSLLAMLARHPVGAPDGRSARMRAAIVARPILRRLMLLAAGARLRAADPAATAPSPG